MIGKLFSAVFLCLLPCLAHAVPLQVAQQGRIMDSDGVPLEGEKKLTFSLFEEETGGSHVWTEDHIVRFLNGYYSVVLGADETDNPLDGTLLANYPLYLELTVEEDETLSPRHSLVSVPYAILSEHAETAVNVDGGTVNASNVSISGTTVVDTTGHWVGHPIAWSELESIPSGFADGIDNDLLAD